MNDKSFQPAVNHNLKNTTPVSNPKTIPRFPNNFVTISRKEFADLWNTQLWNAFGGSYGRSEQSPLFQFLCNEMGLK